MEYSGCWCKMMVLKRSQKDRNNGEWDKGKEVNRFRNKSGEERGLSQISALIFQEVLRLFPKGKNHRY